jgi:hypothetical protein
MPDTDSMTSLQTRSAVRAFLDSALSELTGGPTRPHLPLDLSGLATSSDREVIDSCRLLDQFCGAAGAKSADSEVARSIRDLFSRALSRMKQLPPDPREPARSQSPAVAANAPAAPARRKQR